MSTICPNCGKIEFAPQDLRINLNETLRRWETETSTRFSEQTRAEYAVFKESVFYRCAVCRFGAFIPAAAGTSGFYNDITIDGDYYVSEKWEFKKTFAVMRANSIKRLLDFGCGGGAFLKQAIAIDPALNATGYDKNPQAAEVFKGTAISFTNDLEQGADVPYDMITAFQILEHLEDPFSALRTLKGRLKKDGVLIICVPNADGPIRHFQTALTEIPPHHVNRFNQSSLEVYLRTEGFKVEEVSYEPLAKILWDSYLPVMFAHALPKPLSALYLRLKGPGIVARLARLLGKTGIKTLPLKGHSIYVVARKCAE